MEVNVRRVMGGDGGGECYNNNFNGCKILSVEQRSSYDKLQFIPL